MSYDLTDKKVLVITSNTGVEQPELIKPLEQLKAWGAEVTHAAPKAEMVQTFLHDTQKDREVKPDTTLAEVQADEYDLLLIPGGAVNGDKLRIEPAAVDCVKIFAKQGKPVAAICHAPWILLETGLLPGKTLTSYKSLKTDLLNGKAKEWKDQSVVRCQANDWILITSRDPHDLPDFNNAIGRELSGEAA